MDVKHKLKIKKKVNAREKYAHARVGDLARANFVLYESILKLYNIKVCLSKFKSEKANFIKTKYFWKILEKLEIIL